MGLYCILLYQNIDTIEGQHKGILPLFN